MGTPVTLSAQLSAPERLSGDLVIMMPVHRCILMVFLNFFQYGENRSATALPDAADFSAEINTDRQRAALVFYRVRHDV